MRHALVAFAIAGITLAGMFVFPGHTWLQSDTQIYIPMFERIWDHSLYANELVASRPHLSYTIYDETVLFARRLTGLGFRELLLTEQILFRALAIWGIYLIGRRFHESAVTALFTAAIVSLGAAIFGPAVLTFEYEPVPRGFAVSLLLCAIGLTIHGELMLGSIMGSVAFLYHPPTTVPFWPLFGLAVLKTRRWSTLAPPIVAAAVLLALAKLQPGVTEAQHFWSRIPPDIEQLQRFRAPYNWVSLWPAQFIWHNAIVCAIALVAGFRLRAAMDWTAKLFFAGLPLIGMASIGASWIVLEHFKLALIPQWQPARAVLFTTFTALILCCLAAHHAVERKQFFEAFGWLILPFLIPIQRMLFDPYPAEHIILIAGLALSGIAAIALPERLRPIAALAVFAAAEFLIPGYGKVSNYPAIHSRDLEALSDWARTSTPKNSMFLFPNPGKDLRPGIFRVNALRAVYVDWKAGGQVNYFDDLGREWKRRWDQIAVRGEKPADAQFVVYRAAELPSGTTPVFRNHSWAVVRNP